MTSSMISKVMQMPLFARLLASVAPSFASVCLHAGLDTG